MTGTLITHKQAAALLQTHTEKELRARTADGKRWLHFHDELPRIQRQAGGRNRRGSTIWFVRAQVEAFIAARNQALIDLAKAQPRPRPISTRSAEADLAERRGQKRFAQLLRELNA